MAYSTRRLLCASALLGVLALCGCQRTGVARVVGTNPTPLDTDEAMVLRDWSNTRALYANGYAEAHPTLYPYQTSETNSPYLSPLVETALLVGQTVALPVTAIVTPPWEPVAYHGVLLAPTYTADVPLEVIR